MTHADLAARSGVSVPTVKRMLGGAMGDSSLRNVEAVAAALGLRIRTEAADVDEMRRAQARLKANRIARMVQGTSGLEGQAVDARTFERMVERTYHELLAGPSRRLWAD